MHILVRKVVGKSMWPVLDPGQIVVALRRRSYTEGDVVVFSHDGREKIKRVHAVHGMGLATRYDVRGENATGSTDSRHFGTIEASAIAGKVIWPYI